MKRIALALVALVLVVAITGCEGETPPGYQKKETQFQNQVGNKKDAVIGYPQVNKFAESANLKRRYEELDNVNVGYVYLLNYGKIFAQYTVKGKVSSLNSQFTNPEKYKDCGDSCGVTLPQAEPDGSYGDNPHGIFFWTTDKVYVEWSGDYLYSKQRLDIQQPAENVITKQVK